MANLINDSFVVFYLVKKYVSRNKHRTYETHARAYQPCVYNVKIAIKMFQPQINIINLTSVEAN